MDFITIDFEIANHKMSSACSLGLVFVENNRITEKKYFLIQPPGLELDPTMSKIHGLTFDDLKNAPKFNEVWKNIEHYFNEDILIIAHNAQFDMSVLMNCLLECSLEIPEFYYVDSIPISTEACSGEGISNSLKDRCDFFGVSLENHHDALSDARACAELVIKCIKEKKRKSIHTYLRAHRFISVKLFSELKHQTTFMKKNKKFNKISVTDIVPSSNEFNSKHPFFEKTFVFTGELTNIERKEAMQKVVDIGGFVRSGVSRKTNYLVVGLQDKSLVGDDGLSTKEEKAYELIEKGIDIKIIEESQFLSLLDSSEINVIS